MAQTSTSQARYLGDSHVSPIIQPIRPYSTTPVSFLIHQATDTYIARHINSSARQTKDEVKSKIAAMNHLPQ